MQGKNRIVNTRFWDDSFIKELNVSEKLLFIYLLTNPLTNIAGIYEITLKRINFDTGISLSTITKILKKFGDTGKIYYVDQYILIRNFIIYQKNNPKIQAGIQNILAFLPSTLKPYVIKTNDRLYIDYHKLSIDYGYSLKDLNSNLNLNLNSNLNSNPVQESIKEPDVLLESSFDVFWKVYPKKRGKGQAEITWGKIKPNKELQGKILSAIEKQKSAKMIARDDEFTPYPSTWLNAKSWEDEIIMKGKPEPEFPKIVTCNFCGEKYRLMHIGGSCDKCRESFYQYRPADGTWFERYPGSDSEEINALTAKVVNSIGGKPK